MNYRAVFRYVGHILRLEGLFMLPALLISLFKHEQASAHGFVVSILLTLVIGSLLVRLPKGRGIYAKEGFVTVALGWIFISLFGALPFFISGVIPSFMDCWFETVSGFTTTGSSILPAVEGLPMGVLYWRSFTHWLGGMGVLVFMLAVVPLTRGDGETFFLMRAESPGPSVGKLYPTIRRTSRVLYAIYIAMTLLLIVLLLCGGMPLFDSVLNAFGTAGTGGFGIKNASIGAYDSAYLQAVIGVFMALFGVNFNMYYLLLLGQFRAVWKNEELRLYLGTMLGATLLIGFNILSSYQHAGKAFLDSFFQVSSVMTTTGYATANFDLWPELSRILLVILMLFGASAGSTGGGIKMSRVLIMFKHLKNETLAMLRPRSVRTIHMDGKPVEDSVVRGTTAFMVAYFAICLVSVFVVAFDNFNQETTVTAVISCVNNIGPGLALVGPTGNFGMFSDVSKFVLSLDMLFGRLEIFPMLLLFSPTVWKKGA